MSKLAVVVALTCACGGHTLMRGTVVMKISPTEAYVCLHPGSFELGDRVRVYKTSCQMKLDRAVDCQRRRVGEGWITQALNDHYAAIGVTSQSNLEEGFTVEVHAQDLRSAHTPP
jgi:hypothetical protein